MPELTTYLSRPTYTNNELQMIMAKFSPRVRLSTKLILSAGLRATELFSLHKGLDGNFYVYGKKNIKRRVNIALCLERELEVFRRTTSIEIINRGKKYISYYNLSCGSNWIKRFNQIAEDTIGYHYDFSAFRTYYANHRWLYWFKNSIDNDLTLKFLHLELGENYLPIKNSPFNKETTVLSDFENKLRPYLIDKITGCLLSNNESNTYCFSCINLIELARKKGINLSLDEILSIRTNKTLTHLKNLQRRVDFARYNLLIANDLGVQSLIAMPKAMSDFKHECESLLVFLEKMRVIK
ncbi:hypothetical protein [Photobacterium phosphoreum]|uniref:hypothetical protein n=1 Tax=Photobacterium phosphoreum TaxID=659 RepID=UPI0011B285D4|nr:hypothetical protein [Photobacterium phosphoreum]